MRWRVSKKILTRWTQAKPVRTGVSTAVCPRRRYATMELPSRVTNRHVDRFWGFRDHVRLRPTSAAQRWHLRRDGLFECDSCGHRQSHKKHGFKCKACGTEHIPF